MMSEPTKKRRTRCGQCGPCQIKSDCGQCKHCLNKAVLKQSCIYRKCVYLRGKPNPNSDFLRGRGSHGGRSSSREGFVSQDYVSSPPQINSDDSHQGGDSIDHGSQQGHQHQTSPYSTGSESQQTHCSPQYAYQADIKSPYSIGDGFASPASSAAYQHSGGPTSQGLPPGLPPQSPHTPQAAPHVLASPTWHHYHNTNYIRNFVSPTFPHHSSAFQTPNFSWEWQLTNFAQKQDYFNFNFHRDDARDRVRNFLLSKPGQLYPPTHEPLTPYQVPHVRDPLIGGNLPPEPSPGLPGLPCPPGDRYSVPQGGQYEGVTSISLDDSMVSYVNTNGVNTIEINTGNHHGQPRNTNQHLSAERQNGGSLNGSRSSTASSPNYQELTDVSADSLEKNTGVTLKQDLGDQGEIQISIPPSGITIENIYDDEYSKSTANPWEIFRVNDGFSGQIM